MRLILAFVMLTLNTTYCFSNLEEYVNQEFERNRSLYGTIKDLDFGSKKEVSFIPLGDAGLDLILQRKDELLHLESLNLEGNRIFEDGVHHFIEHLVLVTPNLKRINLSYNSIGCLGATTIGNVALQWPALETLLLRNASIHSKGLVLLFTNLYNHPKLKNFDIASNAKVQNGVAYQLGRYFVLFKHLENVSMENLGFNDAVMSEFLSGMNYYPRKEACKMPLKMINFGDKYDLSKMKYFFDKLVCINELNFYYKSNMYKVYKEKGSIKIFKYLTSRL